jgi:hypothetical protein
MYNNANDKMYMLYKENKEISKAYMQRRFFISSDI